jgi:VanZ family protein
MVRFVRYQLPAFLWVAMIFASSAIPAEFFAHFGVERPWAPKVVHILFFFFLCLFLNRALQHQRVSPFLTRWSLPLSILLCLAFGALDEVHQIFVASRHPRVSDVLLDLTGAALMAGMLWLHNRRQSPRRERITN